MLTLLSPAKKLLANTKPLDFDTTEPMFLKETGELVKIMKTKSVEQIAGLMDLSHNLAVLNYHRYQDFHLKPGTAQTEYPALFLFQGDVYQGLEATKWSSGDVDFSQSHLAILSGLYGMLRPLDMIQPYRLEMGVHLANPRGDTLYAYWRDTITKALNKELASHDKPILINLASAEYFKAVDEKNLNYPVLTINFYERKNHQIKMIGIYAKKARGMMARFIMQNRIDKPEQLKDFSESGYHFNSDSSTEHHLDFIRG
jgi:uncharacterized protein